MHSSTITNTITIRKYFRNMNKELKKFYIKNKDILMLSYGFKRHMNQTDMI